MNVAIIGRTRALLETARLLVKNGHHIGLVWTSRDEAYYNCSRDEYKEFADEVNAEYVFGAGINAETGIERLKNSGCDIGISINYTEIISGPALQALKYGILNAHLGDLPRYRGNACLNWAILNSESAVGFSIHQMVPELDAGPVFLKKFFSLSPNTYAGEVWRWMEEITPSSYLTVVNGLENGSITAMPQDPNVRPLRAFPRKPADSRINWNETAENVFRLIRASSHPFCGAWTFLEDRDKISIWKAEIHIPPYDWCAVPGQVCFQQHGNPVIACGLGMIELTDVTFSDSHEDARGAILSSLRNRLI